ncbi:MAG: response regulator [Magnetococcales bacterium]|nr:response regulator [Magnetococcales bacterium]
MAAILVVDDDVDFRHTLVELLRNASHEVWEATSGRQALELVSRNAFHLILLDLVMPGMDGLETLRELRQRDHQAKVILLTAFSTVETAVSCIKLGASDYLSKPFAISEFLTLVGRTLEERRFEEMIGAMDMGGVLACLAHPLRRAILERLTRNDNLRLSVLMRELAINDHAKLTFHLKHLLEHEVILKTPERTYRLTPQGRELLGGMRQLLFRMGHSPKS